MKIRLFIISSMYPGNLNLYGSDVTEKLCYDDHLTLVMNSTTEFAGSYFRTFKRLGYEVGCSIVNYAELQKKWQKENKSRTKGRNILFDQVRMFSPDVIWIDNLAVTDPALLAKFRNKIPGIKLILAYHCSPFRVEYTERIRFLDFLLTCTPGLKVFVENLGKKAYLVYHGFDMDILDRLGSNPLNKRNLVFSGSLSSGSGFHGSRLELIEKMLESNIDIDLHVNLEKKHRIFVKQALCLINKSFRRVGLQRITDRFIILQYGNFRIRNYSPVLRRIAKAPAFGISMYELLNGSKIVLNSHGDVAERYAGNMRLFEATGVGSCLLTDDKENIGDLFVPGKEVMVYKDSEDCISKIEWLLDNEEERMRIASAGQARTFKDHTVENRCIQIMQILDKELQKNEKMSSLKHSEG